MKNQKTSIADEIQLADSINEMAVNNMVEDVLLNGKRFDCGRIEGYLGAFKDAPTNYNFN